MAEFHLDHAGRGAILKNDQVLDLLREAARGITREVEAREHAVEDGSLLPVEVRDAADTDRVAVSVAIPHPAGSAWKRGTAY